MYQIVHGDDGDAVRRAGSHVPTAHSKSNMSHFWLFAIVWGLALGCAGRLDDSLPSVTHEKDRSDWPGAAAFPVAQDLAILLPRSAELKLEGQTPDAFGEALLPKEWVHTIGLAFQETVVKDAFLTESLYEDWHIAAIRIVPCSTLEKVPSPSNEVVCWPAVRIVWQPTIYDVMIRNRRRDAYSDDRALHVLYDFLPPEIEEESLQYIRALKRGVQVDLSRFIFLRNQAVEQLLNETFALRQTSSEHYESLKYRSELAGGQFEKSTRFLKTLRSFFQLNLVRRHAHTVTAMSLPAGRLPGPIGLWTFLAFDAQDGQLFQRNIEVIDPKSGRTIGNLERDETVGLEDGDERLVAQIDESDEGRALNEQIISTRADYDRLRDRINDPRQTLVQNTSCSTCHHFNRILFDFHNLSYFEALDITVAPRVQQDVEFDLDWVRSWRDETSESGTE